MQGTLEQRIDRLARAFDAFVELSDIRAELAVFEEETTIRHAAQRMLSGLRRRAGDPTDVPADPLVLPADLPGCPGYWLRPAVIALAAALSGDEGAAADAFAAAQAMDAARTSTYLAVGLALAGQVPRAHPFLGAALQAPGDQASHAQRALWRACAHGVYGGPGETLIQEWLDRCIGGLDDGSASAERARWNSDADYAFGAANLTNFTRQGLPRPLAERDALIGPLVAARKLSALSSSVREAMTGEPSEPASSGGTAAQAVAAGPVEAAGPDSPLDALAAVAAALTEEGSEEEITLRRRARQLREVVDNRKTVALPSWDAAEDATLTLLRKDAFGADLRLRRVAITTCAEWIKMTAAELATAASAPPPDKILITLRGRTVQLSASGEASLHEAFTKIDEDNAPQSVSAKLFRKKEIAEDIAWQRDRLTKEANQAAAALAERVSEMHAMARQSAADRDAITAALAG